VIEQIGPEVYGPIGALAAAAAGAAVKLYRDLRGERSRHDEQLQAERDQHDRQLQAERERHTREINAMIDRHRHEMHSMIDRLIEENRTRDRKQLEVVQSLEVLLDRVYRKHLPP